MKKEKDQFDDLVIRHNFKELHKVAKELDVPVSQVLYAMEQTKTNRKDVVCDYVRKHNVKEAPFQLDMTQVQMEENPLGVHEVYFHNDDEKETIKTIKINSSTFLKGVETIKLDFDKQEFQKAPAWSIRRMLRLSKELNWFQRLFGNKPLVVMIDINNKGEIKIEY